MTTKGQFEIMGIAVVIVLVILAGTFFLLIPHKDTSVNARTYAREQLAQSAVDVFLKTDVNSSACKDVNGADQPGIKMYDLIKDVAVFNANPCYNSYDNLAWTKNNSDSVLKGEAQYLFDHTDPVGGDSLKGMYEFTIRTDDTPPTTLVYIGQTGCGARPQYDRAGEERLRILQGGAGKTVIVQLRLCTEGLI